MLNEYAIMFGNIGDVVKHKSLDFPFPHPYDLDARFESFVLGLDPMPWEDYHVWANAQLH